MRKIITAAFMIGAVAVPAVSGSLAFADSSGRTGGAITTPEAPAPANGGDQGWGNCGHNASGGNPHTGDNGNGGDKKADCVTIPNDPNGAPAN